VSRVVVVLAVALAVLGAGWTAYVRYWRHGDAHALAYRDESARLSGFETTHAFTRVFRRANPGQISVLAATGPRSSTAYRLEVVGVTEERGRVVVTMREQAPTLARPGRAALTYPYRLLVLPDHRKPIHVDIEGRP
jgi:hypothetical protein